MDNNYFEDQFDMDIYAKKIDEIRKKELQNKAAARKVSIGKKIIAVAAFLVFFLLWYAVHTFL